MNIAAAQRLDGCKMRHGFTQVISQGAVSPFGHARHVLQSGFVIDEFRIILHQSVNILLQSLLLARGNKTYAIKTVGIFDQP